MRARDNPFRTLRLDALAFRDPQIDPGVLFERWQRAGRRGALVGPRGTGKTTLLRAFSRQLAEQGLTVRSVRLSDDERVPSLADLRDHLARCGRDGVLLLDGVDLLPTHRRVALHWQLGRIHGVLVSAHREGWLPVLHRTRTSPELLEELVGELLGSSAAGYRPLLDDLFERHRGNLRDALFDLYARSARGAFPIRT